MSYSGPAIVRFEVYSFEDNRWILQASFPGKERDDALDEAKAIERGYGLAAKVIRETYYPDKNSSEELTIYVSDKSLREPQAPVRRRAAASGIRMGPVSVSTGSTGIAGKRSVNEQLPPRPMGMVFKMMVVIAVSLVCAGAITGILSTFLNYLSQHGVAIGGQTLPIVSFMSFIVAFLVTAVPLALKILDLRSGTFLAPAPDPVPPVTQVVSLIPPTQSEENIPAESLPSVPDEVMETFPLEENASIDQEASSTGEGEIPSSEIPPPPSEEPTAPSESPAEESKTEPPIVPDDTPVLETQRHMVMHFLSYLLTEIKKAYPQLDAYNRFGIDLLLTGGIDVLGNRYQLEVPDKRLLLAEAIVVLGTKKEIADNFASKYEGYLVEPRYLTMVQVGRNAMEGFLANNNIAMEQIHEVFKDWNKPSAPQAESRIMTIMFTDMVGSTDLTQAHGDIAGQDMVRRHNAIVRAALAKFSGKEIKHTGDGIMASFASAANGVEAAQTIQRAIDLHNKKDKTFPIHLRIGINAGEPIQEGDDLFGSTVQLAARVCAKATTDQILCTNVVRELSSGKGIAFTAHENCELKGFKEAMTLYDITWKDDLLSSVPSRTEVEISEDSLEKKL